MSQFTTIALTGDRYLVEGTDSRGEYGKTVLDGGQFNLFRQRSKIADAQAAFDEAITRFYAPLEKAKATLEKAEQDVSDPLTFVVAPTAGTPSQPGTSGVVAYRDTRVLMAIEDGYTDRLVWINETLEITEVEAPTSSAPSIDDPFAGF